MITFYDIPAKAPINCWSANLWKTRYALNYKGLEYKTVWVEYPDIADTCKKLNIGPTEILKDGSPYYSLPAIHDDSTGVAMAESFEIAVYLDKAYPDTPKLFPPGTVALQRAFIDLHERITPTALWRFMVPGVYAILNPRSEEYFRRTREKFFGMTLEALNPQGEERAEEWQKVKDCFGTVDGWLQRNPGKGPFVMGDTISAADFEIAGRALWIRITLGEDSNEWKDLISWHGGRWARLVDSLKKYESIN